MDEIVARSIAKWPNVPAVYGWLSLDRRGQWRIKGEKIANQALREFIGRNYEADERGRWFFQNGPQRVYVKLDYTPLVVHFEGDALEDHRGRAFRADAAYLDDGGSVVMAGGGTAALLDDRDLARFADQADNLLPIRAAEVPDRFGFTLDPTP